MAGWHAKLLPDNTLQITDPHGHVHTSHPPDHPPPLPLPENDDRRQPGWSAPDRSALSVPGSGVGAAVPPVGVARGTRSRRVPAAARRPRSRAAEGPPRWACLRRGRSRVVAVGRSCLSGAELHEAGAIGARLVRLVVPGPPLVRRGLAVALRRILPSLLAPERGHVEVGPGVAHRLVAAAVDEVGAEDVVAVADERVGAVPLVLAEGGVEVVS